MPAASLRLTESDVEQFATFGFVVLRQHFAGAALDTLAGEADAALTSVIGQGYADRSRPLDLPGESHVPLMGPTAPHSRELLDDPVLLAMAERLLGRHVIPGYAQAVLHNGWAAPHAEQVVDLRGLKFVCYLDELTVQSGAQRIFPGSHHHQYARCLSALTESYAVRPEGDLAEFVERLPAHIVEAQPGDVIVFDLRVWYASVRRARRREWVLTYYADPVSDREAELLRHSLELEARHLAAGPSGTRGYPVYDEEWLAQATSGSRRAMHIARMRSLGLIDILQQSQGEGVLERSSRHLADRSGKAGPCARGSRSDLGNRA